MTDEELIEYAKFTPDAMVDEVLKQIAELTPDPYSGDAGDETA